MYIHTKQGCTRLQYVSVLSTLIGDQSWLVAVLENFDEKKLIHFLSTRTYSTRKNPTELYKIQRRKLKYKTFPRKQTRKPSKHNLTRVAEDSPVPLVMPA